MKVERAKVALVTGASRGIGLAIAENLLEAGRSVVASARDEVALLALRARYPDRVQPVLADWADSQAPDAVFEAALQAFGTLDELVCSAGIVRYAPLEQVSEADLRAQLEVNFIAPFRLLQRAGLYMRERQGGAIVLLASTLGERPVKLTAAYSASKAALINAAQSCALELAPSVRVNVVSPGIVDTEMIRVGRATEKLDEKGMEAHLSGLAQLHPLGRLGHPAEVAEAVRFALEASWMTGSVLTLDGGIRLQ